jgi:glycyl-tRNA synthetase beta chain
LVGVVAAGERPTGSRDPYALRRAASGLVEIQARYAIPLDLGELVDRAYGLLVDQGAQLELSAEDTRAIVVPFILDRVDQSLGDAGIPVDVQRAARGAEQVDPLRLAGLARALHAAAERDDLAAAHAAVVRLSRIADPDGAAPAVDPAGFAAPQERLLLDEIGRLTPAIAAVDPESALRAGAELAPAVDALFDAVMIVDDDPAVRANRLALVEAALAAYAPLGDLTRLQR